MSKDSSVLYPRIPHAFECKYKLLLRLYILVTVHLNKFLFNYQPDALIIQIYSITKLYMFRASSLPIIRRFLTVHSALVSFMHVFYDRFQAKSGWNCSSTLTLLGYVYQKPA